MVWSLVGISENSRNQHGWHARFECRLCRGVHGLEVVRNFFGHGGKIGSFQVHTFEARSVAGCMGIALSARKWLNGLVTCSILRYRSVAKVL